jgi:hypothetical protein
VDEKMILEHALNVINGEQKLYSNFLGRYICTGDVVYATDLEVDDWVILDD